MTSDSAPGHRDPLSWAELRAKVLAAAQANLEQAIRGGKGVELPGQPIPWDPIAKEISLVVGAQQKVFWKETHYFLVDQALDEKRPENRHVAEYRAYYPNEGRLRLTIPPEAREGLRNARRIRAFRVDKTELTLALQWMSALKEMDRGPRALDLWSKTGTPLVPWTPGHLPPDRPLNPHQQDALAAMTTAGGFFVWGPPGTGKTTVITSAVHKALAEAKSVLVTSHTHVAVDNVLQGLVESDLAYGLGIMQPGRVIRHGDAGKVLGSVRDHDFLLVEKAAAVLTNHDARLKDLDDELRRNTEHPDRIRENDVLDRLDRLGVDIERVRRARAAEPQRIELAAVNSRLAELDRLSEQFDREIADRAGAVAEFAGLDEEIAATRQQRDRLQDASSWWTTQRQQHVAELSAASYQLEAARARREAAELRLQSWTAQWFPWVARDRKLASLQADALVSDLLAKQQSDQISLQQVDSALQGIANELGACDVLQEALDRRGAKRAAIQTELDELHLLRRGTSEETGRLRRRARELRDAVAEFDEHDENSGELRASEHGELVGGYDELLIRVAKLNEDGKDIKNRKQRLADEFRQRQNELLATAPVVATTLTALSFRPELQKRRFDVVIIDEAASAEAFAVVYAAAKADTTLAIVGDFLQNAPIVEAEDAEDDEQRKVRQWRTSDVFALAGITDRASAARHPRCVSIRRQYRYPPIIADVVNEFCYDGLLESQQEETLGGEPVITFLDTSAVVGLEFSRTGKSWYCQRTVDAAVDLAAGIPAGSIGYVTPYALQAIITQRAFRARGLEIDAGTSHRFQGREFDTVIFDLMQDDHPRWVAAANLDGPKRAVSAAKLLNVAMTRAKKRLYLIGNWSFVRGHDSPGMQALAGLEGRANFEVRDLAEFLRSQSPTVTQ